MIRSITKTKSGDEINHLLSGLNRVFIIGCGTCATLTRTGGAPEVASMRDILVESGKLVTGEMVVPVACDNLTSEILQEEMGRMEQADVLLVMSCAFGVQAISSQMKRMVVPALDTLFIGKETGSGQFSEICAQCGTCIIGETGGICPVTSCHKGLVNGPCGGTDKGKCEIPGDKDCAWTRIYARLSELDRLQSMRKLQSPRNFLGEPSPGKFEVTSG